MVQFSIVLSPATFSVRPLKGISIDAILDAGNWAALHMKFKSVWAAAFQVCFGVEFVAAPGNAGIETSNRLGLAPPPSSAALNWESVRKFEIFRNPPVVDD